MKSTRFFFAAVILLWVCLAEASHFRGAFYRWARFPTTSAPYQVEFTVTSAWAATHNTTSGAWAFSTDNNNIYFQYPGGSLSASIQGPIFQESSDVTGDYIVVRKQFNYTFPADQVYTVFWNSFIPSSNYGARKSFPNTKATPSAPYGAAANLITVIDLTSGYSSPIAQIPLVLELAISRPGFFATYALPIADPSGLEHTCRMATYTESGINFLANVSSGIIGVTSDCVISWDTSGGTVGQAWAVQVVVVQLGSQTTIPLDFIVTLVNGSNTPTCVSNTNGTVVIPTGSSYTFIFTGTTPNDSYSTLRLDQLVSDSGVFSPAVPINGSTIISTFNVSFTATPTAGTSAELMTLTITDGLGYQAYCSASYQGVIPRPPPTCSTSINSTQYVEVGNSFSYSVSANSAAAGVSSLLVTATGATNAVIPDLGLNISIPITAAVTLTPTAVGTQTIILDFTDSANLDVKCSASFVFYAPPVASFQYGGAVITSITLTLGSAATVVTIVGTSPDIAPETLTAAISGVPTWGTYSPSASYTAPASIPLTLNPTTLSTGTLVTVTFTDSYGLTSTATLNIIVVANPPTCSYPDGNSVSGPINTAQSFTIVGSTTDTVNTSLSVVVTGVPASGSATTTGTTVSVTLDSSVVATGTVNVTYTDYLGQSTTCSVSYGFFQLGCSLGEFDVNGVCQPLYLISAFGETPYGAMGVGVTGNSVGAVKLPDIVAYLANQNVEKIQTGPRHSSLVTNLGNLYMAGLNANGQLGINSTADQDHFTQVVWFNNNSLTVLQCFPGGYHTLVLASNGKVYGFGLNVNGQLGQGSGASTGSYLLPVTVNIPGSPLGVATGFQHSLVYTSTQVYAFGSGDHGQSGSFSDQFSPKLVFTTTAPVTITMATCGGYSSAFLTSNNDVYGYGGNIYGTLGIGNFDNTDVPTLVSSLAGKVKFVSQAEKHAVFWLTSDLLYGTGNNACGELGLGNFVDHDTPVEINFFTTLFNNGELIVGLGTGWTHTLVWTPKTLYVFGCNDEFNLGIPQVGTSPYPTSTPTPNEFYNTTNQVIDADCKGHYSIVLSQLFS